MNKLIAMLLTGLAIDKFKQGLTPQQKRWLMFGLGLVSLMVGFFLLSWIINAYLRIHSQNSWLANSYLFLFLSSLALLSLTVFKADTGFSRLAFKKKKKDNLAMREARLIEALKNDDKTPNQGAQTMVVPIVGQPKVGKTALLEALLKTGQFKSGIVDGQSLNFQLIDVPSISAIDQQNEALIQSLNQVNFAIFVADGDLKSFEYNVISQLLQSGALMVMVVISKSDLLKPEDIVVIRKSVKEKLDTIVGSLGPVFIAADPMPEVVIEIKQDALGNKVRERVEEAAPANIDDVLSRLNVFCETIKITDITFGVHNR